MTDLLTALPARQLHARPPTARSNLIWSLLGIVMFFGFLVYLGGWVAPVLLTDWQIRGTAVRVRGGTVSDGSCTSKAFLEICDATLSAPIGTRQVERQVHYVFASTNLGDFDVAVVADPAHADWLSTDLGLDYFWNRVLSLVVACTMMAAFVGFGSLALLRNHRRRKAWLDTPAIAVPLHLTSVRRTRTGTMWTVQSETGQVARWTVPRKAAPFVLGPASRILGLATRNGAAIMPLDARLQWVDLTAAEREAALSRSSQALPG